MQKVIVALLACCALIAGIPTNPVLSSTVLNPVGPWAKEPEYFRAMEHGFRLDATQHHIHFVDRG